MPRTGYRAPVATACAAVVALGLILAGCGSGGAPNNSAVTVAGSTLSIYASQPPGDSGGQEAADVLDAERLAFAGASHKVSNFTLRFGVVHADEVSQDARDVVSDKTAVAYLGEIPPGTSGTSVQITNELGLLQVSPTDTAAYLTQAAPGVSGSPQHFYPSHSNFNETFGRVVATTVAESQKLVARMKSDGIKTLAIAHDDTDYGNSVAAEVRADAAKAGIGTSSGSGSGGGYFYAGLPGTAASTALDNAVGGDPQVKLYAPSALYDDSFVAGLSGAAQKALTVSAPGVSDSALDPIGKAFVKSFRSRYGHTPAPQAIFGYEAMRAVLAVLGEAGSHAAVRQLVVSDFRSLKRTAGQSALGAYAIDGGDISIAPFVFAGVSGGKLVPRAAG